MNWTRYMVWQAKNYARRGWSPAEIAVELGVASDDVEVAINGGARDLLIPRNDDAGQIGFVMHLTAPRKLSGRELQELQECAYDAARRFIESITTKPEDDRVPDVTHLVGGGVQDLIIEPANGAADISADLPEGDSHGPTGTGPAERRDEDGGNPARAAERRNEDRGGQAGGRDEGRVVPEPERPEVATADPQRSAAAVREEAGPVAPLKFYLRKPSGDYLDKSGVGFTDRVARAYRGTPEMIETVLSLKPNLRDCIREPAP